MTMLRLIPCFFLFAVLALPAAGRAQNSAQPAPLPPIASVVSLQEAELSCPECACERARNDQLMARRQYREVHRKVSTKGPRFMMLGGFAGAGAVAGATAFVATIAMLAQAGGSYSDSEARNEQIRRRAWLVGGFAVSIPFAVGLGGVSWFQKRKKEAEPYRERDAQLLLAFKETRRAQGEQCRGIRRH